MTTALVVVEPRSMPMKQRMSCAPGSAAAAIGMIGAPLGPGGHGVAVGALLLDHLEVAFQPVLHVGRREVARVDQVGLDEGAGLPVRFSTSRSISSWPAEKLLQLLIELISSPSAWYSSM
jgi:hypothetical protein